MRPTRLLLAVAALAWACASPPAPPPPDWEARLVGDAIVLLGEVHDNAELQRLRLGALRRAVERGWRPALALEQLDRERQGEVERARRERPGDPQHVIDAAGGPGWSWELYRPLIELALAHELPLVAANLSRDDVRKIVRGGLAAAFAADEIAALGLDREIAPDWRAAVERDIAEGHCGALPPEIVPAMALGQLARDAVMAAALRAHATRGVVLIAGDGHVRRDVGVPRWLDAEEQRRALAVGYLETGNEPPPGAFDALVFAPPAERPDPCAAFVPPRLEAR